MTTERKNPTGYVKDEDVHGGTSFKTIVQYGFQPGTTVDHGSGETTRIWRYTSYADIDMVVQAIKVFGSKGLGAGKSFEVSVWKDDGSTATKLTSESGTDNQLNETNFTTALAKLGVAQTLSTTTGVTTINPGMVVYFAVTDSTGTPDSEDVGVEIELRAAALGDSESAVFS